MRSPAVKTEEMEKNHLGGKWGEKLMVRVTIKEDKHFFLKMLSTSLFFFKHSESVALTIKFQN